MSQLEDREHFTNDNMGQFRQRLGSVFTEMVGSHPLCVYATGSYGRGEASNSSDLDLFMIDAGTVETPPRRISRTLEIRLQAKLIEIVQGMSIPEFDSDAEFLVIHSLRSLTEHLGSPKDDAENFFTARMLLLLESRPLAGEEAYGQTLTHCLGRYYFEHPKYPNFHPWFLMNDVMRFWKTLCLNYEHHRNALNADRSTDPEKTDRRRKSRVKNYKLKFSRLLICHSLLLVLCDRDESDHPDKVMKWVHRSPLNRIEEVATKYDMTQQFEDLRSLYETFLDRMRDVESLHRRWEDDDLRRADLTEADRFGATIYEMLQGVSTANDNTLRYAVV